VVTGIEVLQKDEGHSGGVRQICQQSGEGFEAAGGGTHADDGKEFIWSGSFSLNRRRRGRSCPILAFPT
jgi:hypothetical protein